MNIKESTENGAKAGSFTAKKPRVSTDAGQVYLDGTGDGKAKALRAFEIEKFFGKYEFSAPYQLSCSDCEPTNLPEMLELLSKEPEDVQKLWNEMSLGYTEVRGNPILREAIADMYKKKVSKEDICVLCPEEGIYIFMKQFLKEGDEVVVVWPAYQSLYELAREKGCKIKQWKYEVENKEPVFKLETLKQLLTPSTKLLVVNFPHNPTGFIPTRTEFNEMIALCEANNCMLFCDEMYHGLVVDEAKHLLPSACEMTKNCVVLSGMSKTMSLPGLRLGWLVIQDSALMEEIIKLKDYTTICPPAPSEILSLIGIRNRSHLVRKNNRIVKGNLQILKQFFEKYDAVFEGYELRGSSVMFPRVKCDKVESVYQLCLDLVEKKGVALLPESVFTNSEDGDRVRLGLGRIDLAPNLRILESYLDEVLN